MMKFRIQISMSLIVVFFFVSSFSQTQWTKYSNNPIMVKQNALYETFAIGQPTCIIDNDTLKMWYAGAGLPFTARILYAYSMDGIGWTKYKSGSPVLDVGAAGEWDSKWLDTPEILKDATEYKLYYFADSATTSPPSAGAALGVATSPDGIDWQKYSGNPILSSGNLEDWDGFWIESPAVLYDDSTQSYLMWYTGANTNYIIRIGLATSPNGLQWAKYQDNPVLDVGPPGSWDDMWVAVPAVIKRGSLFEMWYCGFSSISGFDTLRIGYATSLDGIHWSKYSGNPLFSTVTAPYDSLVDSQGPWAPDVVFEGSEYKMWYETAAGFCLATAAPITSVETPRFTFSLKLFQNYPNPLNPSTTIEYQLPHSGHIILRIVNLLGQEIKTLVDESQTAGTYSVVWDGQDSFGKDVASGVYFYQLTVKGGAVKKTKKLLLLR
ncbi:MAG: T9SS type A sorting domain-containing protein [bacterium]